MSKGKWKDCFRGIYIGLVLTLIICLGILVYLIHTDTTRNKDLYTSVISNIASPENHTRFRNTFFNRSRDYVELLQWVDDQMNWVPSNITMNERYTDPFKILENGTGRGRCGEHSYVYAAACWAQGYETRLVNAFVNGDHMWVEVKINGDWIHVDPSSPQRVNEPDAYTGNYYLFVYSYEADGSSEYLVLKYNPLFIGHLVFILGILITWFIIRQNLAD